jgi:DNA-binding LacI/PurR family transcriptional regulator
MRSSTRVTIKDIAEKAGVSKTTVSFAFNEPAKLSRATCARVLAMAAQLGYVPDPVARTLTTRRTGTVGLLLPQPVQEALRNPYLGEVIQGLGSSCANQGLSLLLVPPFHGTVMEAARRAAVDALVAIGVGPDHQVVDLMAQRRIPLVTIDGCPGEGLSNVGIDDEAAAYRLMKHVLDCGHRNLAVVELEPEVYNDGSGQVSAVARRRNAGFSGALQAAGLSDDLVRTFRVDCSLSGGMEAADQVLAGCGCTAILVMADILAMGIYVRCAETGIRIPADLSVAAFDDIQLSRILQPGLTTISQPGSGKGSEAGRVILSLLQGGPIQQVLMPATLQIRASVGRVPVMGQVPR